MTNGYGKETTLIRNSNLALFLICGILLVISGLAWWNNVYLSFFKRTWMQSNEVELQIKGVFPFLDILCVDHSTISTFIPFLGFLFITVGLLTIMRWDGTKKSRFIREEFPFFQGYNELIVALGLMGTVWGLIMIGYLPNVENLKIPDILGALRTALFSTLVALFWVYIIVLRIVRPVINLFVRKKIGEGTTFETTETLDVTLEQFSNNLQGLNTVLKECSQDISKFKSEFSFKVIEDIKAIAEKSTNALSKISGALKTITKQADYLEKLYSESTSQSSNLNEICSLSIKHSELFADMIKESKAHTETTKAILEFIQNKVADDSNRNNALLDSLINTFKK